MRQLTDIEEKILRVAEEILAKNTVGRNGTSEAITLHAAMPDCVLQVNVQRRIFHEKLPSLYTVLVNGTGFGMEVTENEHMCPALADLFNKYNKKHNTDTQAVVDSRRDERTTGILKAFEELGLGKKKKPVAKKKKPVAKKKKPLA